MVVTITPRPALANVLVVKGGIGICQNTSFKVPDMVQTATLPWHAPCSCFHPVLAPLLVWMFCATLQQWEAISSQC